MKKLLLSLICVSLVFVCCSVDPEETGFFPEASTSQSTVVPIGEALEQLDAVLDAISSDTRSGAGFDYARAIREIKVSGGAAATRSGDNDLPDTMAYVVNFTDDKGFAVLGAQRTLEPVYAVTEAGSFDADKLNEAIARAQKRLQHPEMIPATRSSTGPQKMKDIGTDFAYELLAEAMVAAPRIAADTISVSYGSWETKATVGPLVEVKWDQTHPFNMEMPKTTISRFREITSYRGRFPVGCGVVATAQVMSCTRHPAFAPGKISYNWTSLKSISNYMNSVNFSPSSYDSNASSTTQNNAKQLADVLHYLGIKFNATSDEGGTGTSSEDIIIGLKQLDSEFYANAKIIEITPNTYWQIYDNLKKNKPMPISGWYWNDADGWHGHSWVVDGYLCQTRSVTKQIRYGYTGPIQTITGNEEKYFLHFNWGYRGYYDGYFAQGVFDMKQRFAKDDLIDVNTATLGSSNYGMYNRIIFY